MSSNDHDPNPTPKEGPKKPEWTPGRRLSRKGMSRARGEDLNAHAKVEAQRKAARRAAGTPSRDDVARAALHALLYSLAKRPDAPVPEAFRDLTASCLRRALFDPEETQRVMADMIVRAEHDWVEWVYTRVFRAWRDGGCQGPRPERPAKTGKIPRRPNGTMPWTYKEPRPPGLRRPWRRRRASPDDAA
jgi:hypothetical protein